MYHMHYKFLPDEVLPSRSEQPLGFPPPPILAFLCLKEQVGLSTDAWNTTGFETIAFIFSNTLQGAVAVRSITGVLEKLCLITLQLLKAWLEFKWYRMWYQNNATYIIYRLYHYYYVSCFILEIVFREGSFRVKSTQKKTRPSQIWTKFGVKVTYHDLLTQIKF